ncbi:MAG: CPBP family intramembrane metalloprotease [Acidobacteria bacterium]|nr:CPBP family intramembrane metalloprotease [Acidobacteriota bacterium]
MPPSPEPTSVEPPPALAAAAGGDRTIGSLLPRVALFLLFAYGTLTILAGLLYSSFGLLLASVIGAFAGAATANALAIRIYERGTLPDIGLHWNSASARSLALGVAAGMGTGLAAVLLPALAGLASWKPVPAGESGVSLGGFIFLTAMLLFGAVGEEMLFRGYGLQVLVPVLGPIATVMPMSVLFAAAHMDNSGSDWLGLFNTFLWGVVLGATLLRTGSLWMPIGLHFGWNWILPVLGVNVSGFTMRVSGHVLDWRVGRVWSGGDYGPEGGLFCTIAVALLGAALMRAPLPKQELALLRGGDDRKESAG